MFNYVMFSSESDNWSTPQCVFDYYNSIYHFDVDLCADHNNHKCEKYFTVEDDSLAQLWSGTCWCNPPYGRNLYLWIEKAFYSNCIVVMLLPARTDTKWFHEFCLPFGIVHFIRGRLCFGDFKNSAPFPSMVVIFDPNSKFNSKAFIGLDSAIFDHCG